MKETISKVKRQPSEWENQQKRQQVTINLKNIQASHEAQYQKNKQPDHKTGQRTKQTFLQRHADG